MEIMFSDPSKAVKRITGKCGIGRKREEYSKRKNAFSLYAPFDHILQIAY